MTLIEIEQLARERCPGCIVGRFDNAGLVVVTATARTLSIGQQDGRYQITREPILGPASHIEALTRLVVEQQLDWVQGCLGT